MLPPAAVEVHMKCIATEYLSIGYSTPSRSLLVEDLDLGVSLCLKGRASKKGSLVLFLFLFNAQCKMRFHLMLFFEEAAQIPC